MGKERIHNRSGVANLREQHIGGGEKINPWPLVLEGMEMRMTMKMKMTWSLSLSLFASWTNTGSKGAVAHSSSGIRFRLAGLMFTLLLNRLLIAVDRSLMCT